MIQIIRRIISIAILLIVLAVLGIAAYRYWYQPTYDFFTSDDATVTGTLVRIASPTSGQINDLFIDVGSTVKKNDSIATVKVISTAPSSLGAPSISRLLARVTSPVSGTIATRNISVGETVATGQVIATVVDQSNLWVTLNAIETRVTELKPGMIADVQIPSVNQTFRGKVTEIGSATTEVILTSNPLSLSSNDTDKKVPVKIVIDYSGYRLVPGLSASITIYTHTTPK